jgi:hypothetical protein
MDFPVELVELLKHADVECKLIWIKAEKPIDTIGEVASQAIKKRNTCLLPHGKEMHAV